MRKKDWIVRLTEEDRQTIEWVLNRKRYDLTEELPKTQEEANTIQRSLQKIHHACASMLGAEEIEN